MRTVSGIDSRKNFLPTTAGTPPIPRPPCPSPTIRFPGKKPRLAPLRRLRPQHQGREPERRGLRHGPPPADDQRRLLAPRLPSGHSALHGAGRARYHRPAAGPRYPAHLRPNQPPDAEGAAGQQLKKTGTGRASYRLTLPTNTTGRLFLPGAGAGARGWKLAGGENNPHIREFRDYYLVASGSHTLTLGL